MRFLSHFLLVARPTQQKIDFLCSQMKLTPEQVEMCIQVDPSPNQTDFITWIARMLAKGHIRLPEDGERIKEQLITFNRLKKAPGFTGNKDINSYTPGTLFTVIEDNQGNFSKKEQNREKIREGASVIIRDGDILVYKVTKAPALAELSAGTNWCTAHENMGNTYLSSGPTYVIFDEGSAYAQFHPATNQLKDRTDTEIPDGIVSTSGNYRKTKKTVARFISDPICLKVISQLAKMGEPGVYKYLTGANDPKEKVEKAFAKHGDEVDNQLRKAVYDNQPLPQAELDEMFRKSYYGYNTSEPPSAKVYFRYCMKFMPGKSNERLEKLLLEGRPSLDLLSYCRKFLKGERWPDAEKKILTYATTSTNSMYLCLEYARGIIKGRWPEFEKKLGKAKLNPIPAKAIKLYAETILNQRWADLPGAQLTFSGMDKMEYRMTLGDPEQAIEYADKFIKGRWKPLEVVLRQIGDTTHLLNYSRKFLGGSRDLEMEPDTLRNAKPEQLYDYARSVIKGRDPEIEERLLQTTDVMPAINYASHIMKARWPELEQKLLKFAEDYDFSESYSSGSSSGFVPQSKKDYWNNARKLPETIRDYVTSVVRGRWPEFEKLLLDRYSKHPDEWTKNQQWVDGYISLLSEITEDGEEVTDEDTGDKYHKQVRIATPPTWPEGEKRLATRDPNYEAIIVKEIQEAMASDEAVDPRSSNVEYNLYHAVEILYQYLKALKYFNTEWPEGVKFLNEVEDMRTKREGFWNTFNKFHLSSLLRRKSYALRDCL